MRELKIIDVNAGVFDAGRRLAEDDQGLSGQGSVGEGAKARGQQAAPDDRFSHFHPLLFQF